MAPVDALTRLVDAVRAVGGGFTRRGDVLWVRRGTLDRDDQEALSPLIRRWKPDLLALVDIETAKAVFPGARVVACLTCGGTRWRRAGDGEVCVTCHPDPRAAGGDGGGTHPAPEPQPGTDELLALAEAHGWPRVPLRRAVAVIGTEAGWRTFLARAPPADLTATRRALEPARGAAATCRGGAASEDRGVTTTHHDRVATAVAAFLERHAHGRTRDRPRRTSRRPQGPVTEHEHQLFERVRAHGGVAAVVRSVEEAQAAIARARKETRNG
jgi:hypothetical protein